MKSICSFELGYISDFHICCAVKESIIISLGKSSPNTSSRQSKSSLILSSVIPTCPPKTNNLSLTNARSPPICTSCTSSVIKSQSSCNELTVPWLSTSIACIKSSNSSSSGITVVKHSSQVSGTGGCSTALPYCCYCY